MRQTKRAGAKLFVGYGGQTIEILDRTGGEVGEAQSFVAELGVIWLV
jgi:hypothetical protein